MVTDERENLINEICMYFFSQLEDLSEAKNELYILMDKYEITGRITALVEMKEDRNEFLLKKFIIGKTVKGCTKKTIRAYKTGLQAILRNIGKTADDITPDDIRYYLALRQRRDHICKRTADTELRFLRTFFQYLVTEELVAKDPTKRVERIKCERTIKEALTDIEVEKLRMAADDERERAVIELLLSTGCRVSELIGIRLDEIDGNKVLVHGKGEKERTVYLNAKAEMAIEMYIRQRRDANPYLFPAGIKKMMKEACKKGFNPRELRDWWKDPKLIMPDTPINSHSIEDLTRKIARRAGVEQANPHKFRRTCATMALRRGMPIEQVSKMLGHEQINTTQIYLDLSQDELEQAHKKYVV